MSHRRRGSATSLPHAATLLLLATTSLVLAVHPETRWDSRIDPACCPYPEHDPRDYNWPYSHFQYSEVIPDVMGSYVSMTSLNLTYNDAVVEYGKPLAPSRVTKPPRVAFDLEPDRDMGTLHTLMMVDPDVPYRDAPADGEWVHWLIYDIPGNDTARGKTLIEYAPPAPKPCPPSDKLCLSEHRVTFILWEQTHGPLALHDEDVSIAASQSKGRAKYKARDFAARHRLGMQIGMNFFETWHDPEDGSFNTLPWWHVTDQASLAQVSNIVPTVNRGEAASSSAAGGSGASGSAATKGKGGKKKKRRKDEL